MIWSDLKYRLMANLVPRDARDLDKVANAHLGKLGGRSGLIRSLWSGSKLPFLDENPATRRAIKDSRLPLEKTLQSLDQMRLPVKVVQQIRALLDGMFADRRENVFASGNSSSGKTHVLSAISHELIRSARRVYFRNCGPMVQDLLATMRDLKLSGLFKKLAHFHVLLLDDLGYVQQSREVIEVLFSLLSERYERGSVMLSIKRVFSGWEGIFKDAMMMAAAIDRLVHHCVIVELNLPSYRVEQTKKVRPSASATE